jgi:sarcosine oxidase
MRGDELGYFEPSAGMLMPENCVETQLRLARKHGAVVRCNERVLDVRQDGAGVEVVTDKGTIHAARSVLTAGPWLAALMPPNLRPLTRVYRQTLHWFEPREPSDFAVGRFPIFIWMHGEHEEDYIYGFPMPDGSAGVKVASETYAHDVDPDRVDRTVTAEESAAMHAEHVAKRLRGVTDRVVRSAACLYTVTPDAGFIVDTLPGQDRILMVSACSGHGFKHSAALGEAVAQRLIEGASVLDLAPFALRRFDLRAPSSSRRAG